MFSFILNGVVGFIISFFGLVIAISIIINANRILSSKNIKNYDKIYLNLNILINM